MGLNNTIASLEIANIILQYTLRRVKNPKNAEWNLCGQV